MVIGSAMKNLNLFYRQAGDWQRIFAALARGVGAPGHLRRQK